MVAQSRFKQLEWFWSGSGWFWSGFLDFGKPSSLTTMQTKGRRPMASPRKQVSQPTQQYVHNSRMSPADVCDTPHFKSNESESPHALQRNADSERKMPRSYRRRSHSTNPMDQQRAHNPHKKAWILKAHWMLFVRCGCDLERFRSGSGVVLEWFGSGLGVVWQWFWSGFGVVLEWFWIGF